jgi:hypothetical protein
MSKEETPQEQGKGIMYDSGAVSSKGATRFEFLSSEAIHALCEHLYNGTDGTGGSFAYGINNWQKGIDDLQFLRDKLRHLQDHAQGLQPQLDNLFGSEKNLAIDVMKIFKDIRGIGCNWMFIQHAIEIKILALKDVTD